MKNIIPLYSKQQIHEFVLGNWKTNIFRELHRMGCGFVYDIVDAFGRIPRFSFDMSCESREWAHFSTWWGGIPKREYANPYIHDLYWIHEMAHAGSMVYVPNMNLENFTRKMTDNELHASVVSEVQVYFEIPGLRKLTFKHEIYADRFLKDKWFVRRYNLDRESTFEEMKVRRRDTMMDSNPKNIADFWIHRFYTQNAAWSACWANSYNKVEGAMVELRDEGLRDNVRISALHRHISFLIESAGRTPPAKINTATLRDEDIFPCIPFNREAKAFEGLYWANREHYDDAMKTVTA